MHGPVDLSESLYAELHHEVPLDLVREVVHGVLDERRRTGCRSGAASVPVEARDRLERLLRARGGDSRSLPHPGVVRGVSTR